MAAIKFRDFDKPMKCKNCGCEQVSKLARMVESIFNNGQRQLNYLRQN